MCIFILLVAKNCVIHTELPANHYGYILVMASLET